MRDIGHMVDLHRSPDEPFKIFCALLHRTLGDFTEQLLFAASLKEHFQNAELNVYYRPDRPYKAEIVRMAPQVDSAWPTMNQFPIDLFDTAGNRPVAGPTEWHEQRLDSPDILLLPSMCGKWPLSSFDHLARFRIPDAEYWDAELRSRVGPGWFCTLHYREPTYEYGIARAERDVDLADIEPVVDDILRRGGMVIRLGHPGMRPMTARPDLIDFSEAPVMLQAYAVSRSRFFLEFSPSGPGSFASGFGVPRLRTNSVNLDGPLEANGIVLPQRVVDHAGVDRTLDIIRRGLLDEYLIAEMDDVRLRKNTVEEVLEVVAMMLDQTKEVTGWRVQRTRGNPAPRADIVWPMPYSYKHKIML